MALIRQIAPLFILLFSLPLSAQVSGVVTDNEGWAMTGATVSWLEGPGTTVDVDGKFTLPLAEGQSRFQISFLGYVTREFFLDTLQSPLRIEMEEDQVSLTQVEVVARDNGHAASVLKTQNMESISSKELRKAPCCSLAESFENSPVVDLTYGDPLTGRREIQMLGLRGNYSQLTLEKRPLLDGLASPFALDLIPGPWVQGIQISKGTGSLESGAQGMTGAINTELIKPTDGPKLFLNGFGGTQGRGELNLLANQQLGKSLWGGLSLHGSFTENDHDHDFDRFKDMPDRRTGVGLFRLFRKSTDNWEGQWNLLVAKDRRSAGQQDVHDHGQPTLIPYLIDQDNERVEIWGKTGYFGFKKPHQSIGFIYSGSFHRLNNRYGRKLHLGEQRSGYFSTMYHTRIGNDDHLLSLGGTARVDQFDETFAEQDFSRNERTLGAYGEYSYYWEESREGARFRSLSAILSLRADHHNLGGLQWSPRANIKYSPSEQSAIRFSAGRGWRSPNLLVDNLNWLPSSRQVIIGTPEGPMDPNNPGFIGLETSWNFGLNLTQNLIVGGREMQLVLDLYRTAFQNQVILDAEQDITTLRMYQLEGASRANGLMASMNYEVLSLIDVKLAYKFNDVQQTYATNGLREVPLVPRHRALASIGYDGPRVKIHATYHWHGEQRLIDFDDIPESVFLAHPQRAPAFGLANAQATYIMNGRTEIYGGAENLTNVRQSNAIIGAWEPFDGPYFDASQVYQPLFGRIFFIGFRYSLEPKVINH
jgi:outer membrane receptor for ferrienterochelin and colicins